jgi:tetratricopeptide (TPR) repeat protein
MGDGVMRRAAAIALPLAIAALALPGPQVRAAQERSTHELLRDGAIALEEGRFASAAARFQEAVSIDPLLAEAHLGAGVAALGEEERRATLRSLARAVEIAPAMQEARYALGIARFVFDSPRDAEQDLGAAARADRFFLEARYALGVTAALRDDLPAALASLQEAIRIAPRHAPSHYQLGAVLGRSGDLPGAVQELSRGLEADPRLLDVPPTERILFAYRQTEGGNPRPGTIALPLPVLRPIIHWEEKRGRDQQGGESIAGWYLYYEMALQLEDAGRPATAITLLQRALELKDRSESLAIVAERLIDYSPHFHLAKSYHRLGNYRDAYLHLGVARNEGNASPEAMLALGVLIKKDRLRPRILLQPLPARTTESALRIRGVVIADEAAQRVEISGRDATLRSASREEVAEFLTDSGQPLPESTAGSVLFEVARFLLGDGPNRIVIRPFFRDSARDGDILEVRIVRLPAGDGPAEPQAMSGGKAEAAGARPR